MNKSTPRSGLLNNGILNCVRMQMCPRNTHKDAYPLNPSNSVY